MSAELPPRDGPKAVTRLESLRTIDQLALAVLALNAVLLVKARTLTGGSGEFRWLIGAAAVAGVAGLIVGGVALAGSARRPRWPAVVTLLFTPVLALLVAAVAFGAE